MGAAPLPPESALPGMLVDVDWLADHLDDGTGPAARSLVRTGPGDWFGLGRAEAVRPDLPDPFMVRPHTSGGHHHGRGFDAEVPHHGAIRRRTDGASGNAR